MNLRRREMMNMKKLLVTFMTVVAVTAFATSAFSFGSGSGKGNDVVSYDDFDQTVLSQLNLTVEQITEINVLREAFLKDTRPIVHKMLGKRSALKTLWLQQNPDEEKIAIAHEEMRALRNQIKDKKDVYRLNVYNVLTPEQKEKLKSYGSGRGLRHGMRGN